MGQKGKKLREKAKGKSCRFIHICDGEKEDLTEGDQSVQTSGGEEQDERVVQKLLHYFSCTFYPLLASSPRF